MSPPLLPATQGFVKGLGILGNLGIFGYFAKMGVRGGCNLQFVNNHILEIETGDHDYIDGECVFIREYNHINNVSSL